jgi:hypothetical protein
MNMISVPMIHIRATPAAMADAYTLAEQVWMGDVRVSDEPGSAHGKKINGFQLVATRLKCGGVDVYQKNWRGK